MDRGWSIEAANIKVNHVQIDLIARSPEGLKFIIEVKSQAAICFGVLARGQAQRLKRAQFCLTSMEPTSLMVLVEDAKHGFLEIPIED